MHSAFFHTSAAGLFIKLTTGNGLDTMDGTEEPGSAEVLKKEGAQLLVLHCPTRQVDIPVFRIAGTGRRLRPHAADFATDPAEDAPLIRRKRVSPAVDGDAGDRPGIKELLDIHADPDKGPGGPDELFAQVPFKFRPPLVDEKAHPIRIAKDGTLHHAQRKIGIEEHPSQEGALLLLSKPGEKGLQACGGGKITGRPSRAERFLSLLSEPLEQILDMEVSERQGDPFGQTVGCL
jgi:hypothetical protein